MSLCRLMSPETLSLDLGRGLRRRLNGELTSVVEDRRDERKRLFAGGIRIPTVPRWYGHITVGWEVVS